MSDTSWTMRLYDLGGGGISAANMNVISPATSNKIEHATNRSLSIPLNGIDTLNFSLYLDDPMAYNITRLKTVVKLWRTAPGYADSANTPCFAGVVSSHRKNGEENMMHVTAQSPLWRLQLRFHILNHYLKKNVDTGLDYKQSELMWKLIDLVNNAFGLDDSNTGIVEGTFSASNDPIVAPYFVPKGSNTWTNIFEDIMSRAGGVDIVPEYIHMDGDPALMYFNTDEKRGGSGAAFRYHTGSGDNLSNLEVDEQVVPGEFANYLWAVGEGGPNSGKIAMVEDVSGSDGYSSIGIYMRRADFPLQKKIGVLTPQPTGLKAVALAEFEQSRVPQTTYACEISPVGGLYYGASFTVGDVVSVVGSKGALSVNAASQRIYDATISISDNNIETTQVSIAPDFSSSVGS